MQGNRPDRAAIELDIEVFRNYFLIMMRRAGQHAVFEMYPGSPLIDVPRLRRALAAGTIYTFNGNNFDMPLIAYMFKVLAEPGITAALACTKLKAASDFIIQTNTRGWQFLREWDVPPLQADHVDLIEVAFGDGSLKLYGGRLHSRRLQEMPINPDTLVTPTQREVLRSYCGNDLQTTADLREHLAAEIKLREHMSATYGVDLRSKSDAQIAEAVIKHELSKQIPVRTPEIEPGKVFFYKPPACIAFLSIPLRTLLDEIRSAPFVVLPNGRPQEPQALAERTVAIGRGVYRMGIGGLHSSETCTAHQVGDDELLTDTDVISYYPRIMLEGGLFPRHLTDRFLGVYRNIFDQRVKAKARAKELKTKIEALKKRITELDELERQYVEADTEASAKKLTLNGSFGKFGSPYSILYSPHLLIQVTLTGQLALLMLIEWLEHLGIQVVSANTDGIVTRCPASMKLLLDSTVRLWERRTGFATEETRYRGLFSRDVNNYLALKLGGGFKGKGAFAEPSIAKNPEHQVCTEAVKAWLEHGTPVEDTIRQCTDVRKFLTVRTVRGGAIRILESRRDESLTVAKQRKFLQSQGYPLVDKEQFVIDGVPMHTKQAYKHWAGPDRTEYVGRVVRWYYAVGETRDLRYQESGNRVPNSDGARPLMELPDTLPTDIDYERYISIARGILKDIGCSH
jgi:hypothetical protein